MARLTYQEAARIARVTDRTIRTWVAIGRIHYVDAPNGRGGTIRLIDEDELRALLRGGSDSLYHESSGIIRQELDDTPADHVPPHESASMHSTPQPTGWSRYEEDDADSNHRDAPDAGLPQHDAVGNRAEASGSAAKEGVVVRVSENEALTVEGVRDMLAELQAGFRAQMGDQAARYEERLREQAAKVDGLWRDLVAAERQAGEWKARAEQAEKAPMRPATPTPSWGEVADQWAQSRPATEPPKRKRFLGIF